MFLIRARDDQIRFKRGSYSLEILTPSRSVAWAFLSACLQKAVGHFTMAAEPQINLPTLRIKDATRINLEQILRWYVHHPSIEYCFTTVLQHTRSPKESPARVILLVGRSGAGKSSITEHATKTVGYCNDTKTLCMFKELLFVTSLTQNI